MEKKGSTFKESDTALAMLTFEITVCYGRHGPLKRLSEEV